MLLQGGRRTYSPAQRKQITLNPPSDRDLSRAPFVTSLRIRLFIVISNSPQHDALGNRRYAVNQHPSTNRQRDQASSCCMSAAKSATSQCSASSPLWIR